MSKLTPKAKRIGQVEEALGGGRYRLAMEDGTLIIGYVAGKLKQNRIRIGIRDRVEVELDPAGGHATNRIVWRL